MACTSYNTNTGAQITLTAGTLPGGFCPTTYQALLEAFVQYTTGTLPGNYSTFIISSTEPAAVDRDKVWLKVESDCQPVGFFIYFNGGWVAIGENVFYGTDSSASANTVTTTTTKGITFREDGNLFLVKIANTNTGASTFSYNGLAADDIKKNGGVALTGNEMIAGGVALLVDIGTHYELANPAPDTTIFTDGFWNGSFEQDANGDLVPDHWTRTLLTGATAGGNQMDSTDQVHGTYSFKMTASGVAGEGGATLVTNDYLLVDETTPYFLTWWLKASAANMHNRVEVSWYTAAKALVSTTTVWNENTANPTSWRFMRIFLAPVATAKYMKVTITGGVTSGNAGTARWDDVRVDRARFDRIAEYVTAGTYEWMAPINGWAKVTCVGAGGGGGGSPANAGAGGGGGGRAISAVEVVKNTRYTIVVGAAGAAGGAGNGGNGANSTWQTTVVIGNGGAGGLADGGAAGAGGSGTGQLVDTGGDGEAGTIGVRGGNGGSSAMGGGGTGGGAGGTAGVARGGGGGGGFAGGTGAAGAAGYVSVEW